MVYRSAPPAVVQKWTDRGPWWQRWPPRSRPLRSPVHTHARCQHALARAGTQAYAHTHASTGGTSFTAATTCTLVLDGTSISSFCRGPTRIDKSARGLLSLGAPPARGMHHHPIRRAVLDAPSCAHTAAACTRARTCAEARTARRGPDDIRMRTLHGPRAGEGSVPRHAARSARTALRAISLRCTQTRRERRRKGIRCCEPCEHERPPHPSRPLYFFFSENVMTRMGP